MKDIPIKESLLQRWKNKGDKVPQKSAIAKAPAGAAIPLSYGQQRLWVLQQLYPGNPFYNYSEALQFKGKLDEASFLKSFDKIFEQQQLFRSYYIIEDGAPVIKIDESLTPLVERLDLSSLPEEEKELKLKEVMASQARTSFDLSKPPLWKISLIKTGVSEHIFLLTMHHIITDMWSLNIIKDHLAKNYSEYSQGNEVIKDRPEIQFTDYAYWERANESFRSKVDYWKGVLSGELRTLNLPTDNKRPVKPSFRGSIYTTPFSPQLSKDTLELARKLGVTPFVLLLAVYNILLWKYSGQKDILVGTPISCRDNASLEEILGFFINTIVLRNALDTKETFIDFVSKVRTTVLGAFSNKEVPFDVLVNELRPKRALSVNPFFDAMFLYNTSDERPSFGEALELMEETEFDTGVAKFDLTLAIQEKNGQLISAFEYATDLFHEKTIAQFQDHLRLLLKEITGKPDQIISDISMLTEKETALFLSENDPDNKVFQDYAGIHDVIESEVHKHPENIAVAFGSNKISYEQLSQSAEKIAAEILAHTNGENKIIGLCLDRSHEMIIGLLGILKAGCAYLPIDPEYPKERIRFMLEDSEVPIILSQKSQKITFNGFNGIVINFKETIAKSNSLIAFPKVKRSDIAYVIYTSGSTGQPKGVPITHDNIINSTEGRLTFYDRHPAAFLLMSSVAFDSSKVGIFWTLCTGGKLVVSEKQLEQDIDKMGDVIASHKISHMLMLPSLYRMVLDYIEPEKLQWLETVIVAGESCNPVICSMHFNKLPEVALYNEYGPTEATVWCIAHKIREKDALTLVPIGKAVANAEIYLLNEDLGLVPLGAAGEIYVGGPGLSGYYFNNPALTTAAYVDHPFSNEVGKKLYKTGDLGRYNNEGSIEFLGRADQQVKIRGFRIELEGIDKIINEHSMINRAIVTVEDGTINHNLDSESELDDAAILECLQSMMETEKAMELLDSVVALNKEQKDYLLGQIR